MFTHMTPVVVPHVSSQNPPAVQKRDAKQHSTEGCAQHRLTAPSCPDDVSQWSLKWRGPGDMDSAGAGEISAYCMTHLDLLWIFILTAMRGLTLFDMTQLKKTTHVFTRRFWPMFPSSGQSGCPFRHSKGRLCTDEATQITTSMT